MKKEFRSEHFNGDFISKFSQITGYKIPDSGFWYFKGILRDNYIMNSTTEIQITTDEWDTSHTINWRHHNATAWLHVKQSYDEPNEVGIVGVSYNSNDAYTIEFLRKIHKLFSQLGFYEWDEEFLSDIA